MITEFALAVQYAQVVVHLQDLERPGLLWSDDHVAQGFAWAAGIAAFGVPDHDGECLLQIDVADQQSVAPAALWAVQTPFEVAHLPLQIGTILEMRDVHIPAGTFNLVFEALPGDTAPDGDYAFVLRLHFVTASQTDFAILKQGQELTTDVVLRRDAERA